MVDCAGRASLLGNGSQVGHKGFPNGRGANHDCVGARLRLFRHAWHAAVGINNWIGHYRNVPLGVC